MRTVAILSLLLFLTTPAFSELTKEDLQTLKEDLRTIIKEEIAASEKRTREHIDLKIETVNARIDALDQKIDDVEKSLNARIDAVEKNLNDKIGALDNSLNDRIDDVRIVMIALITLVAAAIAIPQIIIAFKERGQKEMQTQIDQLRKELEAMQQ